MTDSWNIYRERITAIEQHDFDSERQHWRALVHVIGGEMMERWEVSTKESVNGSFEVCAQITPHTLSWGWYGSTKIRIEGMSFEAAKRRAQIICDALNTQEISK